MGDNMDMTAALLVAVVIGAVAGCAVVLLLIVRLIRQASA
jgi:hypothetical protein